MCKSCEAVMINKVLCHERGCPDAWKDYKHECTWCGNQFKPEYEDQEFCCEECCDNYWGNSNEELEES